MSRHGRRTYLYGALGGLAGSLLAAGLFPFVFGNRTITFVLASLLLLCGLVLGIVAIRQVGGRR